MSAKEVSHRSVRYRPFRRGDLDVVRDIIRKSFPEEADSHPEVLAEYSHEAYYQPENLLVAEVDGRVVSQMGLRYGDLWLSGRPFPAALVGTVCTLPDYRGQGIGAGMLRYSFELLRGAGVALSYLHTIPARHNFYRRLGYAPSVHQQVAMTVDLASLDRGLLRQYSPDHPDFRLRPALPADASILDRLYQETARRGTGAWSREELFWKRRLAGYPKLWLAGCPGFELLLGPEPLAYRAAIREGGRWLVVEVAYAQGAEDAVRRLLAADIIAAEQADADRVDVTLPPWMEPEELLAVFLASAQRKWETVFLRVHDEARFLELAQPILTERGIEPIGQVIIGTVEGDLHDIGKNLVAMMLSGGGFKVIDLGHDVTPERFIDTARQNPNSIAAMSALLTTTMPRMADVVQGLKKAGLKKVKVMIGGAPVTRDFAKEIGAHGYAPDAATAVDLAKSLFAS